MRLSFIKRDRRRSEGGVWCDFVSGEVLDAPKPGAFCVLVGEANNPRFRNVLAEIQSKMLADLTAEDREKRTAAWQRAYDAALAEAVLLYWRGLEDDAGAEIPYSRDKARELLNDPDAWQLRQTVVDLSRNGAAYQRQKEAQALGN